MTPYATEPNTTRGPDPGSFAARECFSTLCSTASSFPVASRTNSFNPATLAMSDSLVRIETVAEDRGGRCAAPVRDDKDEVRGCGERGETGHE